MPTSRPSTQKHTTDKETTPVKHTKEETQNQETSLLFLECLLNQFNESAPFFSISQLKHSVQSIELSHPCSGGNDY